MKNKTAIIFITDGSEEAETILPLDILRRANVDVRLVSITGKPDVVCSRGVRLIADGLLTEGLEADMLILPGGKGAASYIGCPLLVDALKRQNSISGHIAAICAAPVTLGKLGLLDGKEATCYPGMKDELIAGAYKDRSVVIDGNIITARAAGASAEFGFALAGILAGESEALRVKNEMCFDYI